MPKNKRGNVVIKLWGLLTSVINSLMSNPCLVSTALSRWLRLVDVDIFNRIVVVVVVVALIL